MSAPATSVLVVDDDPSIAQTLTITLRARGFDVRTAATAADATRAIADGGVDLVLLDLGLPDADGMDVIEHVRGWSRVPIVVLSARSTSDDKADALDAGADDYVAKPFAMNELLARLRAALRHAPVGEGAPVVRAGELAIDLQRGTVTRAGEPVRLTPTEWRILAVLARHPGELVARADLLHEVWGPGYDTETHYLRVYLGTLRRKLETDPAHPSVLITEPGRGYRLET